MPPHQVELLLDLLRDPAVQQWLELRPTTAKDAAAQAQAAPQPSTAGYFAQRLQYLRDNLALLAAAFPRLPAELVRARIIPEVAPHILEPLKMQGVDQFGDYAIQIKMKMMTKPGEQFPIRRKAFAMIKKAFDANGINFAFPTVQVAQGEDGAAAARQMLDLAKTKIAPEAA